MNKFYKLITSVFICEVVGISGSIFTFNSISSWYMFLNKPFFNPPNWIFGPVWTILYLLMGVSLYYILVKGGKNRIPLLYFSAQLILNFLWTLIFFGLHSPKIALFEIILLWISILFTMFNFYKVSKPAGIILTPYILWVSFAFLLNLFIVVLN